MKCNKKTGHQKCNDNVYNTGKVIKVNDYNVEVTGLNDVAFYEEVNISDKASGYVFGIYADRVIVMDKGSIALEGTPEEIFDNPKSERLKRFMKTFTYQ